MKKLETYFNSDIKFYEDYNSIGLVVYDLGIKSLKLGYYTESEFDVDYITLGGGIDKGIVDISLKNIITTQIVFITKP